MFLQYEKDRPDIQMCQKLYHALQTEDVMSIKVSDCFNAVQEHEWQSCEDIGPSIFVTNSNIR